MFLRFHISERDVVSHHMAGAFQAAWGLIDSTCLPEHEEAYLTDLICWFGVHLPRPRRLTAKGFPEGRAICWFRASATTCISKAWEIVSILERHDVRVYHTLTTRPGYIAYEDHLQVAAVPFRDTWR